MTCRAVRQQDEMFCDRCALRWDVKDPKPPKCVGEIMLTTEQKALRIAAHLMTPRPLREAKELEMEFARARTAVRLAADDTIPPDTRRRAVEASWSDFPTLHRV
jgi:hypothetical protein